MSLERVRESLSLQGGHRLVAIQTRRRREEALFPRHGTATKRKAVVYEGLWILTALEAGTATAEDGKEKAGGGESVEVIVAGLEMSIYQSLEKFIIYISKVDSTGQGRARPGVIATFVKTILQTALESLGASAVELFIFGRAQPAYLFPLSDKCPEKKVLSDKGLIRWWRTTLDRAFEDKRLQKSIVVPGQTVEEAAHFLGLRVPDLIRSWTYGLAGSAAGESVWEGIPMFPDDPKSRFLMEERDSSKLAKGGNADATVPAMTLGEFWELMAFRQECSSGRVAGFFKIARPQMTGSAGGAGASAVPASGMRAEWFESLIEESAYDRLANALINHDYGSRDATRQSTKDWLALLTATLAKADLDPTRFICTTIDRPAEEVVRSEKPVEVVNVLKPRKKQKVV